jgi:hypothetical protein
VSFPVPEKAAYVKFEQPASRFALVGVFVGKFSSGVRGRRHGSRASAFRATAIEQALSAAVAADAAAGVELSADDMNCGPARQRGIPRRGGQRDGLARGGRGAGLTDGGADRASTTSALLRWHAQTVGSAPGDGAVSGAAHAAPAYLEGEAGVGKTELAKTPGCDPRRAADPPAVLRRPGYPAGRLRMERRPSADRDPPGRGAA